MKRAYLFFCISMLLMPLSSAETLIFSGKLITDKDKIINGNIFRFLYDEKSNKAFVQTPSTNMLIENGACDLNSFFRVCINAVNFSYRNSTTWVYYYEVDTSIYQLTGSLSTSSKISQTTLLPNEPSEFTITITNPTNFDATGISYIEDLSPFSIGEVKGCSLDGRHIVWNGTLKSKFDKKCTAVISAENIAEKEVTYSFIGSLSYFNGFDNERKLTDLVKIVALPRQLKVTQVTEQDIEINQPFYINMSLQNINKNENIELVATVITPNNLLLLKEIPNFYKDINILKRRVTLEPGAVLNYSIYLQAVSQAGSTLSQNFDYTIKEVRDSFVNSTFIKPIELKPLVSFNTEYKELIPGQKFIVVSRIKNPSRIYRITDIKARLAAPYNNVIEERLDELMPKEYHYIISNTLIIPKDIESELGSGDKNIKLLLNLEYKSDGIAKSLNKSLEVKITRKTEGSAQPAAILLPKTEEVNPPDSYKSGKAKSSASSQSSAVPKETIILNFLNKKGIIVSALAFDALWFILAIIIVMRIKKEADKAKIKEKLKNPRTKVRGFFKPQNW